MTRKEEDMEDLLVSNVFGSIKYLEPKEGLLPILRSAYNINGDLPLRELNDFSDVHYYFWPWMKELNCNNCEPDVLVTFKVTNGQKIILLIEAKYRSGKSSEADENPAPMDQLAREFDNLEQRASKENSTPIFLYVTADFGYPKEDIEESKKEYLDKRTKNMDVLWLSWRRMPRLFASAKKESLLYDLAMVLQKENLVYYEGVITPYVQTFNWVFIAPVNWSWASFELPLATWKFEIDKNFIWQNSTQPISWRFTK